MDVSFTNSREEVAAAKRVETDWAALSTGQQIRSLEVDGYVVMPDLLSAEQIAGIREELMQLPTQGTDYSAHQRGFSGVQWTDSPNAISVIALPTMISFLERLFGDELICTSCTYAVSQPGHPGIAIHTDAQPYGSKIFGLGASSPCLVRVLYYLDDLTPEHSPFKVIPGSHLSLHADGNPYRRYLSHEDEVLVTCRAGSAVIINQKVFHANYPNFSDTDRHMLAIAYRPAWAGPIGEVPDYDPEQVQTLPENVRPLFRSLNTQKIDYDLPNRPDNMARSAPGISPRRYE
ncbi:phytanoyl-CoA dioxygenase family protein [Gimesia chilikensis]|uniref:phytanoyl-CoA dioxygenase family protein n=1 Tax=Gimesia chilikensis TaxID=2605989 RepID=UPI0011ED9B9B|nr:phytanoyl-CoA dioxygenase family protein [Gimesia chilikensis]KAA0134119.1 phytanoyl-CoA dioxygenase family protein [Gimesia chilikensis]